MLIKVAGALITLCGIGHTVGAVVQTLPHYGAAWFRFALWDAPNTDLIEMTQVTAAFWFTAYSFGPLLLLVGATVLWMGFRAISPPIVIAWGLAIWTVVTQVLSGPSPLLLLLVAAALLLVEAHRARPHRGAPDEQSRETLAV